MSLTKIFNLVTFSIVVTVICFIIPNKLKDPEMLKLLKVAEVTAFDKLNNCEFFQTKYPKNYLKLLKFEASKPNIKYYTTDLSSVCAMSSNMSASIWINMNNIFLPGCLPIEATVGHEMLHLAGLPPHKFADRKNPTKEELDNDPIYTIERECLQ